MRPFEHLNVTSTDDLLTALGEDWQTRLIAGGTDLLPLMKRRIIAPSRLVNVKTISELTRLDYSDEGGLVIGPLATLTEVERLPAVRQRFRILSEAISVAASPQLRNMATMGGNLCQTSRCWYFRGQFLCWLKGGEKCYAADGENQLHALFGGSPCRSAYPSDPPQALIALGAQMTLCNRQSSCRTMPVEQFFKLPEEGRRRETIIRPDEAITEIRVPVPPDGSRGAYLKAMSRETWAFPLVSVAVQGTWDGTMPREINIVMGGVAPIPWRATQAEDLVRGKPLDGNLAREAGEAALADAKPLKRNGYKLELIRTLVQRGLLIASSQKGKYNPTA
ncbi:MAG TPA: xanthine dehydrogenase family protein subunit M [Chloroflexota bacterium]|nr:xanthine dehydrogenase family protein subunit M [Chloroflexota bacterium]